MRRTWASCGAIFAVLAALCCACGSDSQGGGCGAPPEKEKSQPQQLAPTRASSGGGDGVAAIGTSHFDGDGAQKKTAAPVQRPADAAPAPAEATVSTAAVKAPAVDEDDLEEVDAKNYAAAVLGAPGPVFVKVYSRNCAPCRLAAPLLKGLSVQFKGQIEFRQLEAGANAGVLPKGMGPLPLPGFILYHGGKVLSRRQGLPFGRLRSDEGGFGESTEQYQHRLFDWFHEALTAKNFYPGSKSGLDRGPLKK